ncbi:MAG: LysE family transporter [Bacteroidetes bacterium]|nr:LysE family transporter [Bacteroidota bacterium]
MTVLIGMLVGVLITVPLGPTSLYVAHRTLNGDTRKAMLVAVGAVLIDVFYCLIITMGLISLIHPYLENLIVQSLFSVFLIGYGIKMLFFRRRASTNEKNGGAEARVTSVPDEEDLPASRFRLSKSHYGGVLIGISMTLANPTLFFSWVAVLSFVTAHGLLTDSTVHKLVFSGAVGVGSMLWFLALVLFVRSRRHIISETFIHRASSITALVIIGFGVYFTIVIFQQLNGMT